MDKLDNKPYDTDNPSFQRFLERQQRSRKREKLLLRMLIATCLGLLFYYKFYISEALPEVSNQLQQKHTKINPVVPATNLCHSEFPSNGAFHRDNLDASAYGDNLPLVDVTNGYSTPVVLLLGNRDFTAYDRTFVLHPGTNASQHIPSGTYGLTLLIGQSWCNFDIGFTDGKRVKVSRLLEVIAGQSNTIKLDSIGEKHTGIHVNIVHVLPPVLTQENNDHQVIANGTLELNRRVNGGFYINGTVNKVPANYQIDTGADITSIPKELANRAGIFECNPRVFHTANGSVNGCVGIAKELVFGSFRFTGFEVAVMPNMEGVLLGMNVLRHLRVESSGDLMRLSSH